MKKIKFLFLLSFTCALLSSCGIETGNPNVSLASGGDEISLQSTKSYTVLEAACNKLVACYTPTLTQGPCLIGLAFQDNFDTPLGINDGIYLSFQAIIDAESKSLINPNTTNSAQCITDINALACGDTEVTAAYTTVSVNDFSNAYKIIPTGANSCNNLF